MIPAFDFVTRRSTILVLTMSLIVTLIGCLPMPLGDPEISKVDQSFAGFWMMKGTDAGKDDLVSILPYDTRTYLVTDMRFSYDAQKHPLLGEESSYKMWLTTVAGETFATLEPKDPVLQLDKTAEKYYMVAQLTRTGDSITIHLLNDKFVEDAKITTAAELKNLVAANIKNPALFDEQAAYDLLPPDRMDEAKAILSAFGHSK